MSDATFRLLCAGALVVMAIAAVVACVLLARGARHLAALPSMAAALVRLEADVEETKGHASSARAVAGSTVGILTKADEIRRSGRGSRPGVTDTGSHRAVAADVEPATARGGVAAGSGGA